MRTGFAHHRWVAVLAAVALAFNAGGGLVRAAASGDAADAWCGSPLSADALADIEAVLAAAKGGAKRPAPDHDAPCHACPMTCSAAAIAEAPALPVLYAPAETVSLGAETLAAHVPARGPPIGGRAPPRA